MKLPFRFFAVIAAFAIAVGFLYATSVSDTAAKAETMSAAGERAVSPTIATVNVADSRTLERSPVTNVAAVAEHKAIVRRDGVLLTAALRYQVWYPRLSRSDQPSVRDLPRPPTLSAKSRGFSGLGHTLAREQI